MAQGIDEIVLKYVGDGTAFPGVPARDLTRGDVIMSNYKLDFLADSTIYSTVAQKPTVSKTVSTKKKED